jgi:hypothetical protein
MNNVAYLYLVLGFYSTIKCSYSQDITSTIDPTLHLVQEEKVEPASQFAQSSTNQQLENERILLELRARESGLVSERLAAIQEILEQSVEADNDKKRKFIDPLERNNPVYKAPKLIMPPFPLIPCTPGNNLAINSDNQNEFKFGIYIRPETQRHEPVNLDSNNTIGLGVQGARISEDKKSAFLLLSLEQKVPYSIPAGGHYKDPQTGVCYVHTTDNHLFVVEPTGQPVTYNNNTYFDYEGKLGKLANYESLVSVESGRRYYNVDGEIFYLPLYFNLDVPQAIKDTLSDLQNQIPLDGKLPTTDEEVDQRISQVFEHVRQVYNFYPAHLTEALNHTFSTMKDEGVLGGAQPADLRKLCFHFVKCLAQKCKPRDDVLGFLSDFGNFTFNVILNYVLPEGRIRDLMNITDLLNQLRDFEGFRKMSPEEKVEFFAGLTADILKGQAGDLFISKLKIKVPTISCYGLDDAIVTHGKKYAASITKKEKNKKDLYHNFPYQVDDYVLRTKPRIDADGTHLYSFNNCGIYKKEGSFQIRVNPITNTIIARRFVPYK